MATAPPNPISLSTAIGDVPGVDDPRAALFTRLSIGTVADLIRHLPHRYSYEAGHLPIRDLPIEAVGTATGQVANCRWVAGRGGFGGRGNKGRFQATIMDDTGTLDVVWFNARWMQKQLIAGMTVQLTGKVTTFNDYKQMVNPKWEPVDEDAERVETDERYRPVYPATEDLPSERIEQIIAGVLPIVLPQITDHLTDDYRQRRAMPTLADAYRMIHAPEDEDEARTARRRLAYDELLLLQTGLAMKRAHTRAHYRAPALHWSAAIDRHIRDRFPFSLTDAQDAVIKQIAGDLQRTEPMNRLLQGDVGSGKTVVALYAMLMAVADRKQAALMAPTELLAEQHFQSISNMLTGSTVRIALLTGSLAPADRDALRRQIEHGDIDIVIGTQALLTESVQFAAPAVVVVDEQHRFGVVQRAQIRSKGVGASAAPHTLVMTATPIPRTLSLTLFGDLDVSSIDALPPGRQPIDTRVVPTAKTDEVYRYIAGRVAKGEQLYVVVPTVDDGELGLKAVRSHAKAIEATWFANHRIAAIHGQLKRPTREAIMDRFRRGEIHVLVATTVIEVGVDVPNASLMIVEHAERFGLAQLHQLRGRIGRGSKRSLCVFIAEPTTDDATARMEAIRSTTDGFVIAERDLEIRGMGELIGTRQAGLPPLRVADIQQDIDLLRLARRDAAQLIQADPTLTTPDNDLLRKRLIKQYGQALGLSDVA